MGTIQAVAGEAHFKPQVLTLLRGAPDSTPGVGALVRHDWGQGFEAAGRPGSGKVGRFLDPPDWRPNS